MAPRDINAGMSHLYAISSVEKGEKKRERREEAFSFCREVGGKGRGEGKASSEARGIFWEEGRKRGRDNSRHY